MVDSTQKICWQGDPAARRHTDDFRMVAYLAMGWANFRNATPKTTNHKLEKCKFLHLVETPLIYLHTYFAVIVRGKLSVWHDLHKY